MGDLGRTAYEAYAAHYNWRWKDGKPLPEYIDQSPDATEAWEDVAFAVLARFGLMNSDATH